jgi:hypothetical protein
MTTFSHVRVDERDVIHARLHKAPKIAGTFGPGFGGFHWRPRTIQISMHWGDDGVWRPRRVGLKGLSIPGTRFGVSISYEIADLPPPWLVKVVYRIVRKVGP